MTGETIPSTGQLLGTVLAVQANFYQVQLDEEGGEIREPDIPHPPHPPYSYVPAGHV